MGAAISDEELVRRFPHHILDHDTKARFRGYLEHQLLVNRCQDCSTWYEPPGPVCPHCWSSQVVPAPVQGTGSIFMAIFLHQGPPVEGVDYATPYPIVTVELDEQEGLRFTATVAGAPPADIAIGRRVRLDWIERAGEPIPAFRLAGRP
jgi:uncharacterized OB-fold protein